MCLKLKVNSEKFGKSLGYKMVEVVNCYEMVRTQFNRILKLQLPLR